MLHTLFLFKTIRLVGARNQRACYLCAKQHVFTNHLVIRFGKRGKDMERIAAWSRRTNLSRIGSNAPCCIFGCPMFLASLFRSLRHSAGPRNVVHALSRAKHRSCIGLAEYELHLEERAKNACRLPWTHQSSSFLEAACTSHCKGGRFLRGSLGRQDGRPLHRTSFWLSPIPLSGCQRCCSCPSRVIRWSISNFHCHLSRMEEKNVVRYKDKRTEQL